MIFFIECTKTNAVFTCVTVQDLHVSELKIYENKQHISDKQ